MIIAQNKLITCTHAPTHMHACMHMHTHTHTHMHENTWHARVHIHKCMCDLSACMYTWGTLVYSCIRRTFVECTEFDSRESLGQVQSLACNSYPSVWWPHSVVFQDFCFRLLLLHTTDSPSVLLTAPYHTDILLQGIQGPCTTVCYGCPFITSQWWCFCARCLGSLQLSVLWLSVGNWTICHTAHIWVTGLSGAMQ